MTKVRLFLRHYEQLDITDSEAVKAVLTKSKARCSSALCGMDSG